MEQIEKATGKQIIRIDTSDLDVMEEVRLDLTSPSILERKWHSPVIHFLANEKSSEVMLPDCMYFCIIIRIFALYFRPVFTSARLPGVSFVPHPCIRIS